MWAPSWAAVSEGHFRALEKCCMNRKQHSGRHLTETTKASSPAWEPAPAGAACAASDSACRCKRIAWRWITAGLSTGCTALPACRHLAESGSGSPQRGALQQHGRRAAPGQGSAAASRFTRRASQQTVGRPGSAAAGSLGPVQRLARVSLHMRMHASRPGQAASRQR